MVVNAAVLLESDFGVALLRLARNILMTVFFLLDRRHGILARSFLVLLVRRWTLGWLFERGG